MQDMTNVTDIDILCLIFSKDKDLPIFIRSFMSDTVYSIIALFSVRSRNVSLLPGLFGNIRPSFHRILHVSWARQNTSSSISLHFKPKNLRFIMAFTINVLPVLIIF